MKISTMSVVVGSAACNARCPFCISKMTPANGVTLKAEAINYKNFEQCCRLAQVADVTTVLLTGKGEPTLFPEELSEVIWKLKQYKFPIIELQTNGIPIYNKKIDDSTLREWFNNGLRTVAISNVGINYELNKQIYTPNQTYIDIDDLIDQLREIGFTVRFATVMIKNGIDTLDKLRELVHWAFLKKVDQLSIRPVTKPNLKNQLEVLNNSSSVASAFEWCSNNGISDDFVNDVMNFVACNGTLIRKMPHGALIYDLFGQNLCLTNCLTRDTNSEEMRQIIYFPDGSIRDSWEYPGARIL